MNHKEAKAMEGTEFTYVFPDGDEIKAYVKKYDKDVGFTCLSLATQTKEGWKPEESQIDIEDDGTFCVMGCSFEEGADSTRTVKERVEDALDKLAEIKATGKWGAPEESHPFSTFDGCPF